MQLTFATESFRNECNNQEQLVKRHGAVRARLIRQRLDEFFNAEVLADVLSLPHVAIHAWPGSPGEFAVEVGRPHWLAFKPAAPGGIADPDASGWKKIDSICITGLLKADEKSSPKPI